MGRGNLPDLLGFLTSIYSWVMLINFGLALAGRFLELRGSGNHLNPQIVRPYLYIFFVDLVYNLFHSFILSRSLSCYII